MKDAKVTIEKVLACGIYDDPKKCPGCCYRKGGYSDIDCTDEGKIITKVTIEILNPIPESAKFFGYSIIGTEVQVWASPKSVTLDGSYNKVSSTFVTEEEGKKWARNILLAVIRKSQEAQAIIESTEIIDIKFEHHRVGFLSSSPLVPIVKTTDETVEEMANVMIKKAMNWRLYHDEAHIIYFPTFRACISYIVDNPIMLSSFQIEKYNKGSNEWKEWKSILGKTINHIRS